MQYLNGQDYDLLVPGFEDWEMGSRLPCRVTWARQEHLFFLLFSDPLLRIIHLHHPCFFFEELVCTHFPSIMIAGPNTVVAPCRTAVREQEGGEGWLFAYATLVKQTAVQPNSWWVSTRSNQWRRRSEARLLLLLLLIICDGWELMLRGKKVGLRKLNKLFGCTKPEMDVGEQPEIVY